MTYDLARGRVVMFGGAGAEVHDDTWEYDGVVWHRRVVATRPSARALAHRVVRERMLAATSRR